ncbi:MAG: hypothetical protein EAX86_01470 [Candidatus Heimdallarchaeota archaeon]|nr:hypothetical protein [Candidatus Heimdallarchaeota archaeon]
MAALSLELLAFLIILFLLLVLIAFNINLYVKYRSRHLESLDSDIQIYQKELNQIEMDLNLKAISFSQKELIRSLCPTEAIISTERRLVLLKTRCLGNKCSKCLDYLSRN